MTVTISASAAKRIGKIVAESNGAAIAVRLEVLGGGCSGYQYKFGFTEALESDDIAIDRDGARLVIDQTSLGFVDGSEVDYGESLMESGFKIVNPNAASSCGCGSSFAVKNEKTIL